MALKGYYSSGQFAKLADVSVRTIRFYDQQNLLKPSYVNEKGARFYTDADLPRLQQILLFKYLGFSLEDIRQMTVGDLDPENMAASLKMQKKLVRDRIELEMVVEESIQEILDELTRTADPGSGRVHQAPINWQKMLDLIHLTGMEKSLSSQYKNASNLSARIALHRLYGTNREGWFPWLFSQLHLRAGMRVLDLGCGDGALWTENRKKIPDGIRITLSDISDGMVRDARRAIEAIKPLPEKTPGEDPFSFSTFDCAAIPFQDSTFDLVCANHVLFYCEDIPRVLQEVRRVLRPSGTFACSAYGKRHMREITDLVQEFDSHIQLSRGRLYEKFGLENGESILTPVFPKIILHRYPDGLTVTDSQPLIEYILSCHGNQNQYLIDRFREFRSFVEARLPFQITKDAGLFLCQVREK